MALPACFTEIFNATTDCSQSATMFLQNVRHTLLLLWSAFIAADFLNASFSLISNRFNLIKEKSSTFSFLWLFQLHRSTVTLSDVQNVCSACWNTYKSSQHRFAIWKKHTQTWSDIGRACRFTWHFAREGNMSPRYHFTLGLWPAIVERCWPSTNVTAFSVPLTDALSHWKPYHLHQWIQKQQTLID